MEHGQTHRRLWAFASLAFFLFASWQTVSTLARTPAFNRSLWDETATGNGRPGGFWTMYHRAEYSSWVARGWYYQTSAWNLPGDEGSQEREAARLDRLQRVREASMQSLRLRPGNATTWMLLAEAEHGLGNMEAALGAWRTSYEFAPNSATRARSRVLFLMRLMSEPDNREPVLSAVSSDTIRAELAAMEMSLMTTQLAAVLTKDVVFAALIADR